MQDCRLQGWKESYDETAVLVQSLIDEFEDIIREGHLKCLQRMDTFSPNVKIVTC
jgi:hypothetical protein